MPDDLQRRLRRLDDVPAPDLWSRVGTERGRPPARVSPVRRVAVAVVALALATAAFVFLATTFRAGPQEEPVDRTPIAELDPTAICDVPAYDPDVAMLGDGGTGVFGEVEVGPRTFPLDVLEAPGEPSSSIGGTATDALRSYLASPEARYAPSDGWRTIGETGTEIIFAAPHDDSPTRWWVIRFEQESVAWRHRETEIVDQFRTPAQRGHGLALSWTGEVTLSDGSWASELTLTNESAETWSDDEQGYAIWGSAHIFDPATGLEVDHSAESVGDWGAGRALASGEGANVPLSLGGQLGALNPGGYAVVACVPRLGLASPVGSLRVVDDPTTTSVHVLTYPTMGGGMDALGGGRLVDHLGCLAVAHVPGDLRPSYVLWPDGYALVTRDGRTVLIDAVGTEIAGMGDEVRLGGGNVHLDGARGAIGGIPESCQTGGESYFITSGPA